MSDPSGPPPELRASDADREQTVELLQHGAQSGQLTVDEFGERVHSALAARTRAELRELTADLSLERARHPTAGADSGLTVREGPGGTSWVVAVLGGHDKKGRWRVGGKCTVISVLGGSDIDLNDAELSGQVTQITMFSLLGGSDIRVPDGVNVQVSDFALMGGNDVTLGDEVPPPGAPTIQIRLVSILGGSEVMRGRKPSKEERRQQRELRRAHRRDPDS
jgi:hypothetical protein